MNTSLANSKRNMNILSGIRIRRGLAWGLIILGALIAFEIFNYSTTEFALKDVLGDLSFVGIHWSTILAIAFCGIDFAGIARLFTPEKGKDEPAEVWYLFGAWILAATMNAMLTWWGVSVAIVENSNLVGSQVIDTATLIKVVPVFVAVMVWLIRVLIIGTFSVSGDRLFSQSDGKAGFRPATVNPRPLRPSASIPNTVQRQPVPATLRTSQKTTRHGNVYSRPEPSYHNISMSTSSSRDGSNVETRK